MRATEHRASLEIVRIMAGRSVLLILAGELDTPTAPQLRDELADAVDLGRPLLLVDLDDVTFIAAPGILPLFTGVRCMSEQGGRLAIVCTRLSIRRVIEIVGLQDRVEVYGSTAEALAPARHTAEAVAEPSTPATRRRRAPRAPDGSASYPVLHPPSRGLRRALRRPR